MEIEGLQKQYNLGREAASRLLKVSVRTLDRYIKSKKVSSRVVDGRIWLDKEELEHFRLGKTSVSTIDSNVVSRAGVSTGDVVDRVDNIEVINQGFGDSDDIMSSKKDRTHGAAETYKNLYLELKGELKEKQDRLEIANYRVGQLEAQVKSSVPMLEYHREKYEQSRQAEEFKAQISESTNLIKRITLNLKYERFSKRVFLIILLIILAIQPLWLLFTNN